MSDDDIVTILREDAVTAREDYWHISPQVLIQAADEIERLRDARRDGDERTRQQIQVTTERIAERDALAAQVAALEEALRSCRNLTHLQHKTPQDVRQIGLMVSATVDKALAATGKAGE